MTLAAFPGGSIAVPGWPKVLSGYTNKVVSQHSSAVTTLDASGEKCAIIGRCRISGGGSKTIDTSGSSAISFLPGSAITFADGSTTIDVGIQGVSTSAGPIAQPDGAFDVKGTLTGGTDTISAATRKSVVPSTGTKTIADGDLIAVVIDMTARAGSDSVLVDHGRGTLVAGLPYVNTFIASAWLTTATAGVGNVVITFSDGTLGVIDETLPFNSVAVDAFTDSTNPDERGVIIRVPWACTVNGALLVTGGSAATADGTVSLYSDPLGTPNAERTASFLGEHIYAANTDAWHSFSFAEYELAANTDYCLAIKATAAGQIRLANIVLPDKNLRAILPFGTNYTKATRDGSSGAFTKEVAETTMYYMALLVNKFDDGAGGAGGLLTHPGMSGGMRG